MDAKIHPTALVEEGARIGPGCVIHAHAIVNRHCDLDADVEIHPFAVVGGAAQDLGADPDVESTVRIGARTVIREHATIHRAARQGEVTRIGADCYIMAAAHIAHDCQVADRVIMANAVLLGGHVQIGGHTFMGGAAVVHQHCRIGEGVMVGGGSRISEDIAPFSLTAERNVIAGLNVVGLRRRGVSRGAVNELRRAFHRVYEPGGNPKAVAEMLLAAGALESDEVRRFLEFFRTGARRFARPRYNELERTA